MIPRNLDRGLLVIRIATGVTFAAHGYLKLFAMGHAGVTGFFESLHIPMAGVLAWVVALLEFGGGIALAAGVLTRAVSLLFVVDMLCAIYFAVWPKGFVGGYELEFLLGAVSLGLAFAGGGAYSVDARLAASGRSAGPA